MTGPTVERTWGGTDSWTWRGKGNRIFFFFLGGGGRVEKKYEYMHVDLEEHVIWVKMT